ncbi:short chain dehydrogenase [Mycena floridula]|nr:short chain dehydrogenase [Mycena floridula]
MSSPLVWFITGTSTVLGHSLVEAALARGDKVIAATARARSFARIEDLKSEGADILELDVTAPLDKLKDIAKVAVVTNFGAINVARAFLPYMRERRCGTILWMSFLAAWSTPFLTADHRKQSVTRISDYKGTKRMESVFQAVNGTQPENPQKGAEVVVDVVHSTGFFKDKPIPRWFFVGTDRYSLAKNYCEDSQKLELWKESDL